MMGPGMFDGLVTGIILLILACSAVLTGITLGIIWLCNHLSFAIHWIG